MKYKLSSLRSLQLSVVHLSIQLMCNRVQSENWIFSRKDFYHVHIITPYGVNPLIDCFDFAFLSYAEAARYASMFSCFSNTRIVISFHHFTRL